MPRPPPLRTALAVFFRLHRFPLSIFHICWPNNFCWANQPKNQLMLILKLHCALSLPSSSAYVDFFPNLLWNLCSIYVAQFTFLGESTAILNTLNKALNCSAHLAFDPLFVNSFKS